MRAERLLLRAGEYLVGRACRHLPHDIRDERFREWAAELPAILQDRQIGPAPRRAVRMLSYAADTLRGTAITRVTGSRPLPRPMAAVFCLLLVAALALATSDIWTIVGTPDDPLNYLRLAWNVLLAAYPLCMLLRAAPRVTILIVSGSALAGMAVNLSDAARAPADWVNYLNAALLFLLLLAAWTVDRRARAKQT